MYMSFWTRVEEKLSAQNTTYRWIAESIVKKSETTVSGWHLKGVEPRASDAVAIAKALGTTVEELVTGQAPSGSLPGTIMQLARDIASLPPDEIAELTAIVAIKKEKHRSAQANASAS
jgi:hypothetical protein